MPSTSAKQAKFMRAVANSPKFAKKVGVKQSVGKDFEMADKKKTGPLGSMKDIVERGNRTPYEPIPKSGPATPAPKPLGPAGKKGYAKGGLAAGHKSANGIAKKGLTKGMEAKMAGGGKCYAKGGSVSARADGIAKKGKTKGRVL